MTAKSTTKSATTTKSAAKSKPATKSKPVAGKAKAVAKPKGAATSASSKATGASGGRSTKAAPRTSATRKAGATTAAATRLEPIELVKPLLRVRQAREFTGKRVTRAELEAITEVARWSGTSRNEQPLRFVAVRDQERIRQIADIGLPQTRGLPTATAAVAIVEPNEPERGISRAFDDGRAAERMLIAAHALGLGGGISRVRPDVREGIDKLLNLPSNRSVRTIVAFGHPTEEALAPKSAPGRARLSREELIYEDRWPDPPIGD